MLFKIESIVVNPLSLTEEMININVLASCDIMRPKCCLVKLV